MSYVINTTEYRIIPDQSFKVIRQCATCNKKTKFHNSKRFRVNANGNKVDVWLIYNCEKCKHTLNLSIYERKNPSQIDFTEYQQFLGNDTELAEKYGINKSFFNHNKAEINWEDISYSYQSSNTGSSHNNDKSNSVDSESTYDIDDSIDVNDESVHAGKLVSPLRQIHVINDYNLNLRGDKVASEILQISRSQLKKLIKEGKMTLTKTHGDVIIDIYSDTVSPLASS